MTFGDVMDDIKRAFWTLSDHSGAHGGDHDHARTTLRQYGKVIHMALVLEYFLIAELRIRAADLVHFEELHELAKKLRADKGSIA